MFLCVRMLLNSKYVAPKPPQIWNFLEDSVEFGDVNFDCHPNEKALNITTTTVSKSLDQHTVQSRLMRCL